MKFQSVDIEGILNVQRVSSLPVWNYQTDIGRLIYVRDEKCFYRGTSEGWERATSNGLQPVLVIENYLAKEQDLCLIDTRNGPITITLPANPKMGATIAFIDVAGTFESNQCTVAANGKRIQRLSKDLVLDINDFAGYIVYDPLTSSWKVSIEGVAQIVGNTTLFVHKTTIIADNIDGTGGQQQFNVPWTYNPQLDNISVSIQGVQQYHFEKTNQNSITLPESVPAGTEVQICSIPLEGSFDIEHFVSLEYLEKTYIKASDLWEWILAHDGKGSKLDADYLQGISGEKYLLIENVLEELLKVDGTGSGLDADRLDGYDTAQYGPLPNSVVVTTEDGTIDRRFLPFGRGGLELVQKFEIPEGASAIDLTNLDTNTGYLVKGFNITPTTNDVRLSLGVYNETEKQWKDGFTHWTCSYTTAASSGLRDFNSNSDMTLAKHVRSVDGGVNLELWIDGFYGMTPNTEDTHRTKTVRSTVSFLGYGAECASLYESVGALPKNGDTYSAVRLYFAPEGSTNLSLISKGGMICVYRWVDEFVGFSLSPDLSGYRIIIKEGTQTVEELEENIKAVTTHYPECTVKNSSIDIETLGALLNIDRNRIYPDFEIRDTHYTVEEFVKRLERDVQVQEGSLSVEDVLKAEDTHSRDYGDFTAMVGAYTVKDLTDALEQDRTTDKIPEFDLRDTHYTVSAFMENADRDVSVTEGTMNVNDVKDSLNTTSRDYGDFTALVGSYTTDQLSNVLETNRTTNRIPEFNLKDTHYTVADIDNPRIVVKQSAFTVENLENNEHNSDADLGDINIRANSYTINTLNDLQANDFTTDTIPEFKLIDGSPTTENLEKN